MCNILVPIISIYEENKKVDTPKNVQENQEVQEENPQQDLPKEWRFAHNHPKELILGDPSKGITTCSSMRNICRNLAFLSQVEPKTFLDAKHDEHWIMAMQEELNQFERNEVWYLVPRPKHQTVIGTKWVFRNKLDENGIVVRNKARFVAQGYN